MRPEDFIVGAQDLKTGKILLMDKPAGWTSFDVVGKVRSVLRKKFDRKNIKVGHGGTLDPLATGLLLVAVGPATKRLHLIQQSDKTYEGTIRLGAVTPSYDLETEPVDFRPVDHLTREDIRRAMQAFLGKGEQLPPLYSAVRKQGKRLYELARRGQSDVERTPRPVEIHAFDLLDYTPPDISFRAWVSKGTYIRSLAHDLGQKLGTGAYLFALRRTAIGQYRIEDAIDPETWFRLNQ